VVHNTALNSSDNLHSYPPDIHHSSGQLRYVCWREGITRRAPLAGCPREDCVQARCDGVPVFTRTGRHPATSLITSSQPLTLLLAAPSTICQQEPSPVPRCRLSTYGCRAFHYAGPTVWNSLPDDLASFVSFRQFLETTICSRYLRSCWGNLLQNYKKPKAPSLSI